MKHAIAALLLALLTTLSSCSVTGGDGVGRSIAAATASSAQLMLRPYSFHFEGEVRGECGVNSTYFALDAHVSVEATYRAPTMLGGVGEVVWRKTFERGEGQRAYKVVFGIVEGAKFVQVFSVPWAEARLSMPWLSPATTAPLGDGPEAVTPKIIVEEAPAEPVALLQHSDTRLRPPEASTA